MINKIIEYSVKNRYFVFLVTFILIVIGINSFQVLPIDAVPDVTNTQVQINTQTKGIVPEEIERLVTFPIEYSMNGIPGVESIRSISRFGISQVTVIFKDEFDIYKARQLVMEKLQAIDFSVDASPELGPISTGLGEIFHYSIEAKVVSSKSDERIVQLMELRNIQEWFIKPRLLSVKGVTEINTIGGHEKKIFIQPNIKLMTEYGIHFDDIENALLKTNSNVGGGYIEQTDNQILIRGEGILKNINEVKNVVVKKLTTNKVIRVLDVADVSLGRDIRTGAASVNGEEAVVGTVFMLLGENSRVISQNVYEKIQDLKNDLPDWVELKVLYDRSEMVNKTLDTLKHNLVFGAFLVIVFLLLLVGNLRAALITSIIIPISLLITFILMRYKNVSGNLMSLGALDFGIIIDGAVIVIENCVHRIQNKINDFGRDLTREEIKQVVIDAAIEIRSAAGFGELIVITVFVPLFALTGIEGKMFGPMATTFIFALGSALLLSFTLVPALAATFLAGNTKDTKPYLMMLFEKIYTPTLNMALSFKKIIMLFATLCIFLGGFLFFKMGSEFIPQLDEGDFAIQIIRPANINLTNSLALQSISENIIREFPQVKHVFSRTGAAEVATDPMGVNISDCYVMLHPVSSWPSDKVIKNKKDLMEKIKEKLELHVPGQVLMFSQPVELRFNELLEGTRAPISAKIFGDDLDTLSEYAREVEEIISNLDKNSEVEAETKGKGPLLQFNPNFEAISELGLNADVVLNVISTAIGGKEVGVLYDGVRRFPIVSRLSEDERNNADFLSEIPVGVEEGFTLPLKKLTTFNYTETYSNISRENALRRVAVLINPNTRDIESYVLRAQKEVSKKLKLKEGYFIEWGGAFKNLRSAKEKLSYLLPLSLIFILFMLYAAFKNILQVLMIFICAPMSLIGGVLALIFLGMPFSISAGVGFIALSGISILNGVVLVSYFNRLAQNNLTPDEVVKEGAISRLRPVLMTALTDIFGFLPMMFSTGLGAEVQKPLASVVVGGMISSTLLTLIVIPSMYRLFYNQLNKSNSQRVNLA